MKRFVVNQISRQIRPICRKFPISQKRFNSIQTKSLNITKFDLIPALENDLTIEKLNKMINIEDNEILQEKDSALRKLIIQKLDYEIDKLFNNEFGNFLEFMNFLESNINLIKQLNLKNKYLIRVLGNDKINYSFNNELKKLDNDFNKIYNFLILNTLLSNKLNLKLNLNSDVLFKVSQLFVANDKIYEFYSILINLNSYKNLNSKIISKIRYDLINGSKKSKELIYFYSAFKNVDLKDKMLNLYSFELLNQILINHIKLDDNLKSKFYMDLLVSKFSTEESKTQHNKSLLYNSIMYYSIIFGNYKNSIMILNKMNEFNVKITSKLIHILITSLRKKKLYKSCFELFRILPTFLPNLDNDSKAVFINEFFSLLREKFDDPKILLAHFVTIFPNSVKLLNDLNLLNPIINNKGGKLKDLSLLQTASINEFYIINSNPTINNLTELYLSLFNYILSDHELNNPAFFSKLFDSFIKTSKSIQSENLKGFAISSNKLDESILNIFLKKMLNDFNKPSLALKMTKTYLTNLDLKRFNPQFLVYLFHKYNEHGTYYNELIEILKFFKIELSLRLIIANVLKSYNRGDIKQSKEWYDLFLNGEYNLTDRRFIKFIYKNKWEFPKNFNYKLLEYLNLQENPNNKEYNYDYLNDSEDNLEIFDDVFIENLLDKLHEFRKK